MAGSVKYPDRVALGEDGVFRWTGRINDAQKKKVVRIVFGVCGGMCLGFILMSLLMMDGEMLGVILLCTLAVMAIAGTVSLLYTRSSLSNYQPYEMTDEYLLFVGGRRTNAFFPYGQIRKVKIDAAESLLEVRTLMMTAPFFVPKEDFNFVKDYVLRRLPADADVEYL